MRAEVFLLEGLDGPEWMEDGACTAPGVAFLSAPVADQVSICRGCLVRKDCLAHAIENDERFGVWGGRVFGPWPGGRP